MFHTLKCFELVLPVYSRCVFFSVFASKVAILSLQRRNQTSWCVLESSLDLSINIPVLSH